MRNYENPEFLQENRLPQRAYYIPENEGAYTLLNGEWKKGWNAFCETVRTRYTDAIRNAFNDDSSHTDNALFSHYLDCEAHTDVWRELFPTWNKFNERDRK